MAHPALAVGAHGFSVMSMKQEKPSLAYGAANQRPAALGPFALPRSRTHGWFGDEIQARNQGTSAAPNHTACFPLAAAAIPYVRWRGYFGS
jgi:hypothetical protein